MSFLPEEDLTSTDNLTELVVLTTTCEVENISYPSSFGVNLAVPEVEAIATALMLFCVIVFTIIGNILVILSVFSYKPLRTVQNFFIVSLAVADLMVAILVLPLNVAYSILGRWLFGIGLCKMWLTSDVLCCTASILNLCAIALDRFWAITDPINYALKRTLRRVLWMIFGVWVLSAIISSPPLLGWNDWPEQFHEKTPCKLTEEQGYVIYSSLGSFFIPLLIMATVYVEIFIATKRRLRKRAQQNSNLRKVKNTSQVTSAEDRVIETEQESGSSENNEQNPISQIAKKKKVKKKKKGESLLPNGEDSVIDTQEGSSESQRANSEYFSDQRDTVKIHTFKVDQFIEEKQRISLSKERRAARTLGIIMGVFVVCWLPFFLMYVILPFCQLCCPTEKLKNFITWLGYINSAINPIIYTIFNMDFRKAFKKLLRIKI
ncbi:hypothetical protein RUM44_001420 [Polyplax serrata]